MGLTSLRYVGYRPVFTIRRLSVTQRGCACHRSCVIVVEFPREAAHGGKMSPRSGKFWAGGAALALVTGATIALTSSSAEALPPLIPSPSVAAEQLAALTVAPDGSMDGYSRDEFPHWHTVEGSCDTREEVLKRDGHLDQSVR